MAIKRGLGKGLDALLGDFQETLPDVAVNEVDIYLLDTNAAQPRKHFDEERLQELAASIRRHGILQPIVVRKQGDRYAIVMGERRYRAARLCGLSKVPVVVKTLEDAEAMEAALVENLQREDLNPIEEASGIRMLMLQEDLTQEEAAERLGKSRPAVANALRLLNLCEPVQDMLRTGALQSGHARALLALRDGERQLALARRIENEGLSVREVENLIRAEVAGAEKGAKKPQRKKPPALRNGDLTAAEDALRLRLGTRVQIQGDEVKGKVVIDYYSAADLQTIYDAILG